MKKKFFLLISLLVLSVIIPSVISAKPIYIRFKLGFKAKWSIVINSECEDGKGICFVVGNTAAPRTDPNFIGYEDETDKINIRVSKEWPEASNVSGGTYEVLENSQIDPKLINLLTNFKFKDKTVFIKKGIYKVIDDGDFYLLKLDYYII